MRLASLTGGSAAHELPIMAIRVTVSPTGRLCQGDILSGVEYVERVDEHKGILEVSRIVFTNVIVLTQDCDLEQDHIF